MTASLDVGSRKPKSWTLPPYFQVLRNRELVGAIPANRSPSTREHEDEIHSSKLFWRILLPAIRAIFWDIGGVLLNNAWDHSERADALERFHLDASDFNIRHEPLVSLFERGQLSLDEYLDQTVFYTERSFSREEFRSSMFALSQPFPEVLQFARSISDSGKYLMGDDQ